MITPTPLHKGSTVALLAPSGPGDPALLAPSLKALSHMGLEVIVMESCRAAHAYLAGSDALRAADINTAFADRDIHGIIAWRGGYGVQRILPLLDYELIRRNPKPLVGYSDITALHLALNQVCGLITYHGPMPATDFCLAVDSAAQAFTLQAFTRFLFNPLPPGWQVLRNPPSMPLTALAPGSVSGRLTGGNLSLLASSLGTPYEVDTRGSILFIEEVQEAPYRIDRMLLQLKMAGKFKDCQGIWLGSFAPEDIKTLELAITDLLLPEGKPILAGFACGHCQPTLTLPLGAEAAMDTARSYAAVYI